MTFKLVYAVISGRAAKLSSAGCMLEGNPKKFFATSYEEDI
jgi:hypothetical protein